MKLKHFALYTLPDLIFILCAAAFLFFGALQAIAWPTDVNEYENRTANRLPALSRAGLLSGDDQDAVENALTDQVYLARQMEEDYFSVDTASQLKLIRPFLARHPDMYIGVLGEYTFGGNHLVYRTRPLAPELEKLDARIANINGAIAAHPELRFYACFIEKETDLDLVTGEKTGVSDYVMQALTLPEPQKYIFRVDSFAQLDAQFFRTDHHWNNRGSYAGYCGILSMLKPEQTPLVPLEEKTLWGLFSGSKAKVLGAQGVFAEKFPVYAFDYPPMDAAVDGKAAASYGNQSAWLEGKIWADPSYQGFYGLDSAEVVLDTHRPEQGSILILGESYDNAIVSLLASHYDKTYCVDLRHYARVMGEDFELGAYTRARGVKDVLLVGNLDYYALSSFDLEG